jgi:leucyl-tRNA synthetase
LGGLLDLLHSSATILLHSSLQKKRDEKYILPMFPILVRFENLTLGELMAIYVSILLPMSFLVLTFLNNFKVFLVRFFGLPAENAAIDTYPSVHSFCEIRKFKIALIKMDFLARLNSEISTCDPLYYIHTQRLFLDLQ